MPDVLRVHVVWRPWSAEGKRYAERIFSFFQSDVDHPVMRGLGMPVSFWTAPPSHPKPPAPLGLGDATHNAVLLPAARSCTRRGDPRELDRGHALPEHGSAGRAQEAVAA
jgi:hypothetical protein